MHSNVNLCGSIYSSSTHKLNSPAKHMREYKHTPLISCEYLHDFVVLRINIFP